MSQQILGNVPPIVFVKDKEAAAVKKVIVILDSTYKYHANVGPRYHNVWEYWESWLLKNYILIATLKIGLCLYLYFMFQSILVKNL